MRAMVDLSEQGFPVADCASSLMRADLGTMPGNRRVRAAEWRMSRRVVNNVCFRTIRVWQRKTRRLKIIGSGGPHTFFSSRS